MWVDLVLDEIIDDSSSSSSRSRDSISHECPRPCIPYSSCMRWRLMFGGRYEEAEKVLEEALGAAEAVGGASHPRVGLVLLTLARVYARTRRISFAEGLYRWPIHRV